MNKNPFVLPGFGQSGQLGQNPVLASMEMMRQAWEGLASSGGMDASAMGRMMSVEEMDKRIADLRAVENWLRMNLSMLSSTIQGLEVQRATVSTLKSFVDTGMASMASQATGGTTDSSAAEQGRPRTASPLEEALGLKPAPGAAGSSAAPPEAADAGAQAQPQSDAPSDQADIMTAAASAAQGWWALLQQQFQTLAAATAASAEGALADMAEAGKAAPAAAAKKAPRKTAAKTPSKTVARKTSGSKTAARTATARKTAR